MSETNYLQHNAVIADGLEDLGEAVARMAKQGSTWSTHHKTRGEGNFVLSISEGSLGADAVSFHDLFRVSDGKIVAHWDVIEPSLPSIEAKHGNGKFGGL